VSGTLVLVAIGLLLMGLLAVLFRRTEAADGSFSVPDSGSSLAATRFEDRRKDILDRIFGREDWDFVLNHASKETRRLFLIERRKIALYWLSEIRSASKAAMRVHVAHASKSESLRPMQELRLALDYFTIRVKCGFMAVMILLRGPVSLRSMVRRASHLSGQFHGWLEVALQTDAFAEK
jgi:hypothetical protein